MFVKGIKRIAVSGQPKRKLGAIQTKIVILSSQRLWGKQKWRDKKRENRGGGNALHGHIEHKAAAQKNRNKTRGGGERTERRRQDKERTRKENGRREEGGEEMKEDGNFNFGRSQ